jgi:hypothetical protein
LKCTKRLISVNLRRESTVTREESRDIEEKRESLGTQTPREWVTIGEAASEAVDSMDRLKGFPSDATHVNVLMEAYQTSGNLYTYLASI